ncbi:MAG: glycosyltransferase family 4 protein [Bacteroidetes bacterium]|nr:glycosyltransferase family 4 protein [Bacteroidota bacterium]HET6244035.1 glycosyltransferase family 4 protein [Bacteroidia bacterium]
MKKVLVITYYWPPSGGAGVQRWLKFVKYLPEFQIEPIVLTVDENEASYALVDHKLTQEISPSLRIVKTKTFEPFEIYKKISGKKEIPFGGFANEGKAGFKSNFFRFIRGNLFIPDARRGWNKYVIKKASEIIVNEGIDTVITTSPPHSTQLVGLYLKKKFNINWIADMRDPWTDIYFYKELNHTAIARKIDAAFEKKVLLNADKVIVVSEDIKRIFTEKDKKIDPLNIVVIPNGFDAEDFTAGQKEDNEYFTIAYTGSMTLKYRPQAFFKAIKNLADSTNGKIKFILAGSPDPDVVEEAEKAGIKSITEFKGYISHSGSIEIMHKAAVLFLSIPDVENNKGILTGKLFEYLASQRPIICTAPKNGDAAKIINDCDAGEVVDYDEQKKMEQLLQKHYQYWLLKSGGETRKQHYLKFSRKNLTASLAKIIKK